MKPYKWCNRDTKDHNRLFWATVCIKLDNLDEYISWDEKIPRQNHEEIENLNRPITSKEIKSLTPSLPIQQSSGNSTKYLKN